MAVLAGLRRCFFEDTFGAAVTSGYGDMDLTSQAPWITDRASQVMRVQYGYVRPVGRRAVRDLHAGRPRHARRRVGQLRPGQRVGDRPAPALRTGQRRRLEHGPTEDDDTLSVDLDYAAAAGHIEAWHLFPSQDVRRGCGQPAGHPGDGRARVHQAGHDLGATAPTGATASPRWSACAGVSVVL